MQGLGLRKKFFAWALRKGDKVNLKTYDSYKRKLFREVNGTVVEIGPGTGVNFEYLPKRISWIGIEPNAAFHERLRRKAAEKGIQADLLLGSASEIPLENNSADFLICTLVLCSVDDVDKALQEIRRILKPGGKMIFIEHVAARPGSPVYFFQTLINPFTIMMADGCHANRQTWISLENAHFSALEYSHYSVHSTMILHRPHIMGIATK
jgi:ubiquinone/menaquinone biosynthesis C-methylase UbiE